MSNKLEARIMTAQANVRPARNRKTAPPVSLHAARRMKERSIPAAIVDALLDFGDRAPAGKGAESCFFTKRSWRRYASYLGTEARHFERYRSTFLIVSADGEIVTTCWRH